MPETGFTLEELAAFQQRFEQTPHWQAWQRVLTEHGSDVLAVTLEGAAAPTLKVAKTGAGFMATGFDGWGLTVSDTLPELLDILTRYRPIQRSRGATPDLRRKPAAA